MRLDWRKSMRRTIIVNADDLEVKSAPSVHSRTKSPKIVKRSTIKMHRIHYKPNRMFRALLLGILSIVTFGLAAIAYLFYKISKRQ
ncbi:MAG TPA: hypothetical protein PLO64_04505 [Methanothermobacter sp.]|nr:hypothetical protein [Methanothermobacter sp.]HOL69172.1 hypothetical protein [Methanothermobacter sp.]HPQ03912.1 hypothetical protein [Methanothermobacter sp.]HPU37494.1 hypothetical protein [Methanothermobacter sp.]